MNETAPRRPLLALLLLFLLVGCQNAAPEPPLAGASLGGPFTLTSHEGKKVSAADFDGRYRLVYFGFTFCPDVCPVDLQIISAGLRQFEQDDPQKAQKVQPIFITVDPARDTPDVLAEFVEAYHPRLIGLTGTEQEIAAAAKAYGVYFQRGTPPQGSRDYLVDHSRMAVLYGPEGKPIAIIPHDQGPAGVVAELERWVA